MMLDELWLFLKKGLAPRMCSIIGLGAAIWFTRSSRYRFTLDDGELKFQSIVEKMFFVTRWFLAARSEPVDLFILEG